MRVDSVARRLAVEGQAQLEEHILQAHDAQAHRAPAHVRGARRADGVEVEVDHAVELAHRDLDGVRQLLEVEAVGPDVAREIDRAEVADRGLAAAGDLEDLGAQIRQMHGVAGLGGLVAGAVGLVLEGHPAVAGLREHAHHPGVQVARPQGLAAPGRCASACT